MNYLLLTAETVLGLGIDITYISRMKAVSPSGSP